MAPKALSKLKIHLMIYQIIVIFSKIDKTGFNQKDILVTNH
jgi:hypothetical protein